MRGWSSLSKQHLLHEGLFVERGRDAGQEGWNSHWGQQVSPAHAGEVPKAGEGSAQVLL